MVMGPQEQCDGLPSNKIQKEAAIVLKLLAAIYALGIVAIIGCFVLIAWIDSKDSDA